MSDKKKAITESERIERFEAAYNRIDRALTDLVSPGGDRRRHGYAARVRLAAQRRRRLSRFVDFLLEIGELRNALVHGRIGNDHYLAVPSQETVVELEHIEQAAFSPERVVPRFQRRVITLKASQTLAESLKLLRQDGVSRYPVYSEHEFVGLLTTNGLARWCAAQLHGTRIETDTAAVTVRDVLAYDHRRESIVFVSRETLIDDVDDLFREGKPLEAVVITEHGRPEQTPLGLICAQDLAMMQR